MGPLWVLPIQAKLDSGVIAIKRYSTFPKGSELELHDQTQFSVKIKTFIGGESYPSADVQSAYTSTKNEKGVI